MILQRLTIEYDVEMQDRITAAEQSKSNRLISIFLTNFYSIFSVYFVWFDTFNEPCLGLDHLRKFSQ